MLSPVRILCLAASVAIPLTLGCDALSQGPKTAFSGEAALGYAKAQVDFGPRVPGTDAAKKAGDWIVAEMQKRADTVMVQEWKHVTQQHDTLPMRNIFARFKPSATERVLYVTHWDTRPTADDDPNLGRRASSFDGANDGASGVGLFIALADVLKKTPPSVGVDLLFVDGEDWGDFNVNDNPDVLIGATYFAKSPIIAGYKPLYGVLFDMIADADLLIRPEENSLTAAPEVVQRVWGTAKQLGYGKVFSDEKIYGITDDHVPLNAIGGFRVVDVIDLDYPDVARTKNYHHTSMDTMDKLSAKSFQIVGDVAVALVK